MINNKHKSFIIFFILGCVLIATSFFLYEDIKTVCLIAGVVVYALSFIILIYNARAKEDDGNRYKAKKCLLSRPEMTAYAILKTMLEPKYRVYPQIALLSIVDKLTNTSYRNELFRIIDFVVFDNSLKPLLAIELNDASHNRKDRRERDEKVKDILSKAGIKIVFISQSLLSDTKTMEKEILKALA